MALAAEANKNVFEDMKFGRERRRWQRKTRLKRQIHSTIFHFICAVEDVSSSMSSPLPPAIRRRHFEKLLLLCASRFRVYTCYSFLLLHFLHIWAFLIFNFVLPFQRGRAAAPSCSPALFSVPHFLFLAHLIAAAISPFLLLLFGCLLPVVCCCDINFSLRMGNIMISCDTAERTEKFENENYETKLAPESSSRALSPWLFVIILFKSFSFQRWLASQRRTLRASINGMSRIIKSAITSTWEQQRWTPNEKFDRCCMAFCVLPAISINLYLFERVSRACGILRPTDRLSLRDNVCYSCKHSFLL